MGRHAARLPRRVAGVAAIVATMLAACSDGAGPATEPTSDPTAPATQPLPHHEPTQAMDPSDRATALRAGAAFQDVDMATAAGYVSSLDTLGCFEDAAAGGMGVHLIDDSLMDATVDIA